METIFTIVLVGILVLAWPTSGDSTGPQPPKPRTSAIDPFQNVTPPTCTTNDNVTSARNGIIDERYRWINFNVHPDPAFNSQELQAINDAMYRLWQIIPCVPFGIWPQDSIPFGDYVRIIRGSNNGCNSWIGRLGGRQDMNLQSPDCFTRGVIYHEMLHALGFHHEHGRYDRDDYINIHWENILDGLDVHFNRQSPGQFTTFNVPYNLRSVMHYRSFDFSRNGLPVLTSRTGAPLGWHDDLEVTDIRKLIEMYNC